MSRAGSLAPPSERMARATSMPAETMKPDAMRSFVERRKREARKTSPVTPRMLAATTKPSRETNQRPDVARAPMMRVRRVRKPKHASAIPSATPTRSPRPYPQRALSPPKTATGWTSGGRPTVVSTVDVESGYVDGGMVSAPFNGQIFTLESVWTRRRCEPVETGTRTSFERSSSWRMRGGDPSLER